MLLILDRINLPLLPRKSFKQEFRRTKYLITNDPSFVWSELCLILSNYV